jgi:transcriptional regulator GlxA family with amidase domain
MLSCAARASVGPYPKRSLWRCGPFGVDARAARLHHLAMTGERSLRKAPTSTVVDLRVARALRAVDADPARAWRVPELAKLAGASRATFARLFHAATGTSPKRWLAARRLAHAATLLSATESTLAEIAAQVGYVSEFSLSRAFKRRYGIAPAHYRQASGPIRCAA